jgi:adenosylcobinamide-phosphate synthase
VFVTAPWQPWLVLAVLVAEAVISYPKIVASYVPHPVVWIGNVLAAMDKRWNRPDRSENARKFLGVLCVLLLGGGVITVGLLLESIANLGSLGIAVIVLIATTGLAQRSLYDHVAAVYRALKDNDLEAARRAVSYIVGRDVSALDEAGVSAAAIESLSESLSDGIVAPAFWLFIGGLPGLFLYKAVNTADSMIGHMEPRWRAFGWAAARTDDVMNFIPARIAGLLVVIAGLGGWRTMRADARKHASPNSGWPEAAMAGALNLRLGGAAFYDGVLHERPRFGEGSLPQTGDLRRALRIYIRACGVLWLGFLIAGVLWL